MPDQIKILCLMHLPPPDYGVTLLNRKILDGFGGRKFTLDAVSINTAKQMDKIGKVSLSKLTELRTIMRTLKTKLDSGKYEFCYFTLTPTGLGFLKDLFFVRLVKKHKLKILYHLHGKGIRRWWPLYPLYRYCFSGSKVIFVSFRCNDARMYIKPKSRVFDPEALPNAIEPTLSDSDFNDLMQERKDREKTSLLFLSNMVRSKGVFVALAAARILKDKGYEFNFSFAGDWCDIKPEEFFFKVKEYGLRDRVRYLGFKKGAQKYELLKASDVLVYPTYNDIFGIVNLEAMEYGLPVVTTYEGAIPEVVGHGSEGLIVSRKSVSETAEAVARLIKDKNTRLEMGKRGRKKFLSEYTFDRFKERLGDIFTRMYIGVDHGRRYFDNEREDACAE